MLCQNCGKNNANTHIKTMVNGDTKEFYICTECASSLGYNKMFNSSIFNTFNTDFDGFLGGFLTKGIAGTPIANSGRKCSFCQISLDDIMNKGKAGCASCYDEFYDRLLPSIKRLHGNVAHTGKVPRSAGTKAKTVRELEDLKAQLQKAVDEQKYENAAVLRDKIKEKEKELGDNAK